MSLHQYYGACVTDLNHASQMNHDELAFLFLCLSKADSQTFLLPQDYYFLADPHGSKLTGSVHEFGTLDVQALYCLMQGIGMEVDPVEAASLLKAEDKEGSGHIG